MSHTNGVMRVTFEVEVDVGPWGGDGTFDTLYDQAKREAESKLRHMTLRDGNVRVVRVVGVGALIVERNKP